MRTDQLGIYEMISLKNFEPLTTLETGGREATALTGRLEARRGLESAGCITRGLVTDFADADGR